ncbi:hypothetical protein GCM10010495_19250 [Kitasatospora herbaricolor]|uniref:hypothetical protein n=1 Tax=Kitasatospora herbaricolor TaxID=68217 RepID=UPI00174DE489|nr:hypothetical protein [Kitasatospora herbaricolor]MDQ0308371.1 hypothetical protein [Kitasatospora herbaricolor]GGV06956.1 hypothetical protein GCM10010495_19250 [Kitasatospora herbaricolor]
MGRSEPSGIGTARIEQLFETLRSDVTTTVQPPVPAQRIRRAAARRRHRRRAVLGAGCAVAALALWGVRGLVPVPLEGSAGASPADRRIVAEMSLPGQESRADLDLLLPTEDLPVAEGAYGPWLLKNEGEVDGPAAGESQTATAAGTPSGGPSSQADDAGRSATCLGQVAGSVGATSLWGRSYSDFGGYGAVAAEYVLAFPTVEEAGRAAERLRAAMECGPAGVTALSCSTDVIALQTWRHDRGPVEVEEITVQQAGTRLVALAVHRLADATTALPGGQKPQQEGLVRPEFHTAADSLRARLAAAAAGDGAPSGPSAGATPDGYTGASSGPASPEPAAVTAKATAAGPGHCQGA